MVKFYRLVIKHRLFFVAISFFITLYLGYQIRYLSFSTSFESTLPQNHPYVKIHLKFQQLFGGANTTIIGLKPREGDIFQPQFLEKLKVLTEKIMFYPDAITSQVISLSRAKVKNIEGTPAGVDVRPFYKMGVPKRPEEIEQLKESVFSNELIRGSLVSGDGKMAFIVATFKDEINYRKLFNFFEKLQTDVAGKDLEFYISGKPMLIGWIYHNNPKSLLIFVASVLAELALLFIFLNQYRGIFVCLPLLLALINTIWGLGLMGLARFNLDPLGLVIPFVIVARIISHGVQILDRYGEYCQTIKDREEASIATINIMFIPSAASIITDAAGLYILCVVPIPLLRTLGWISGTWLLGAVLGVSLLLPILFCYLPSPLKKIEKTDFLTNALTKWGEWLMAGRRNMVMVMGGWLVVFVASSTLSMRVEVGDVHPGSPLLWPDSPYNSQDAVLNRHFPGTNPLYIIIEGKHRNALKEPEVLRAIEALEREFQGKCPSVGGTETLVGIVKKLNREYHEGDPKWSKIPATPDECGFYLWAYEVKGEPGDFDRWADIPFQHGNLICYFKDHQGETIRHAIQVCKDFLTRYPIPSEHVELKLAGGIIGVTASIDETVAQYSTLTLVLALLIIFICCVIPYRSFLRGIVLIISLITGNLIASAYMALAGMGMTISILPVASIGAGLGIDYGIYMLSRIINEMQETGGDIKQSIIRSFSSTGRAVVVTGLVVVVGIVFWYFSEVKFQADMGFLLAFLLAANVVGALFLVPTLTYCFRSKLFKEVKGDEEGSDKN
ncbi:MAG: MMPL family transporter [Thermodesulfobacteriota bacterium]|jgi:predicted RND superfamily exporter protein|nr:MAG: MMPL family transporter [Thermodesulfobacteriota bacterium]